LLAAVAAAVVLPAAAQARDVTQTAQADGVHATLSYRVVKDVYSHVLLTIARQGSPAFVAPLREVSCGSRCATWVPGFTTVPGPVRVRDLDGDGEPEVILDLYTGGAHCCVLAVIYRWDGSAYRRSVTYFGNYGYKLRDLNGDGIPELSAYDERFAYAFGSFAVSFAPPAIFHYQAGKLVDVTRDFPSVIKANAREAFTYYRRAARQHDHEGARSTLAAWTADQCLLGKSTQGFARVEAALKAGDLGKGPTEFGLPSGERYIAALRAFLKRNGYL
jgi:hypothetical protein